MTEIEWLEIFGDNLKEIMIEQGYTQKSLADAIGVTQSTVSRYICNDIDNRKMPTIKSIVNMSYILDIPINDLIDFGDTII